MVICDPSHIRRVFVRLIDNAIRYSSAATTVSIRLSCRRAVDLALDHPGFAISRGADSGQPMDEDARLALVAIADQGRGISDEQQQVLFNRHAYASGRRDRGLGLGLYLSREVVIHNGGCIWVESRVEEGSTFYFTLPCADPPDSAFYS